MAKKFSALLLPIIVFLFLLSSADASDDYVLQTGELSINAWHFHYSKHTFSISNPGFATLRITKTTPEKAISRGFLFLNRRAIPLKHFLKSEDIIFEKKIKLKESNRLNVFLWGTPDAKIKIDIRLHDAPEPPPTISAEANPLTILLGDSSTLTWETTNAESVRIDNGIGDVAINGSIEVVPVDTTTYTLTATGIGGSTTAEITVTVNPLPPNVTLSANPDTIVMGSSAIVSWTSEFANSCVIEPDIGVVALNGSITVSPVQTTTYKIIATGDGGESTAEVLVTVTDPEPTVDINAADTSIMLGESTTLNWTSTHADTCTISPGIGTVNPNGSLDVSPVDTTTYTITATGTGGSASDQVTVAVQYPLPTVTFSASPSSVLLGSSSTLSWTTTHTDTVEIDHNIGSVATSGDHTVTPNATTTYTLTATGPGGTTTSEVTVDVTYPQPSVTLQAAPDTITLGETTNLSWTSSNAVTLAIDQGIGSVASQGNMPVSPSETTTYTITGTGVGGDTATASATVTVQVPAPAVSLLADPETILSGASSTLIWSTSYADTVTIEPDLGAVAVNGTQTVIPSGTTTYTLTATGPGGTTVETVTVNVIDPPTVTVTVDPVTLIAGNEAALTWETTNADTVTIDQGIGAVADNGTFQIAPETTTIYTVTATGPGGNATGQATVNVNHPPFAEITASPNKINPGEDTTLSWNTQHAETVTIDQGIGDVTHSGSLTVNPNQNTTYTITATGPGGSTTASETITMIVPKPVVTFSVAPGQILVGETAVLTWAVTGADSCAIEPGIGTVANSGTMDITPASDTTYTLIANGPGGISESSLHVTVLDLSSGPVAAFDQTEIRIATGESATLAWTSTGGTTAHIDNGVGATTLSGSTTVQPQATTTYTLTVTGATGSGSAQAVVYVTGSPSLQPEDSFGYQYNDLIPEDATVEAYDERRFAVISGFVHDDNGDALQDVSVSILKHPEYGTVNTDGEGRFAIPVQGGASMVVDYQKTGLISSQRQVKVPWNDVAVVDTVVMIQADSAATIINFDGNPGTVVTHRSTPVKDEDGTRSTTLVFSGDNMAYAVDANGNDIHTLSTITTRATEFATPPSMPAELPPRSGFTYCAELSVDGVQRVRFDKPVIMWVDNFLGFPVGEVVPVGYYDRDRGLWVPSENGVVVLLLDTDGDGTVDGLDADGDNAADDLDNDGTFTSEVAGLADSQQYAPGTSYWRAEVTHFTSWDCNWPFGPPEDAEWPDPTMAPDYSVEDCRRWPNPEVSIRARVVHKAIPIPGTDMALNYASNRSDDYSVVFDIEASHDQVPASLEAIVVRLRAGGQTITKSLPPLENQRIQMVWDGQNFRGQPVTTGNVPIDVQVGFRYQGVYQQAADEPFAFGQSGTGQITGDRMRQLITLWDNTDVDVITAPWWQKDIAKGWNLNIHHLPIDSNKPKLLRGDGTSLKRFTTDYKYNYLSMASMISTVAGGPGYTGSSGDGGPATEAYLNAPRDVEFDAAGNMYIADGGDTKVRKVDTGGIISTVADGANLSNPVDLAIDNQGNLFIADQFADVIYKVDTDGIITTFAGGGQSGGGGGYYAPAAEAYLTDGDGDNGPATEAILNNPSAVALDAFGNVYINDSFNDTVRKVDPNGIITTIAGGGPNWAYDHPGPATQVYFSGHLRDITLDGEGNLFILNDHYIYKVDNSGIISTLFERDYSNSHPDDGITVDDQGNIYLSKVLDHRVIKINRAGEISIIAGNGIGDRNAVVVDGIPSTESMVRYPIATTFGPDGALYIAQAGRVRKLAEPTPYVFSQQLQEPVFTDTNGLGYVISESSLHARTIDLHTGRDIHRFSYDDQRNLISVTDRFGGVTEIQRDANGTPYAIVAPNGLTTHLTIDDRNHLSDVKIPGGGTYTYAYTDGGLILTATEPSEDVTRYTYDSQGRVKSVTDIDNDEWQYPKNWSIDGQLVTRVVSPEGNRTIYRDVTESGQLESSVVTDANGSRMQYERVATGVAGEPTIRKTLQCDTQLTFAYGFDSNYNFEYLKSAEEVAPSLLRRTFAFGTQYVDNSGDNIADVAINQISINGNPPALLEHDLLASVRTATSPEGRTAVATYNADTLLVENISVPGFHDTFFGYDNDGLLTSIQSHTRQRTYGYNAQGFLTSVTESPGRTTTYTHDALGRIKTMTPPNGNPISFSYDGDGNMTVVAHPLGTHALTYGADQAATAYNAPASGSYTYLYDKDRNLEQVDFPSGKRIYYQYEQGVLQGIQTPEGPIDFSYAAACDNKIDAISKGGEAIHFGFDGPMLTAETLTGTVSQTLEYEYNAEFNVSGFTYAGETQIIGYDMDGLLVSAGPFSITRNVQNGLPETVTGSGLNTTRTFNRFGEIDSQVVNVGGQPVSSWTLGWEDSGQIGSKTESIGGISHDYVYGYDDAGRLESVIQDGAEVARYTYDADGVRQTETNTLRGIASRGFVFSPEHQVMSAGGATFTYNLDGFLATRTEGGNLTAYDYSSRGELLSATLPDGRVISYRYDPLGRRIAKQIDGVTVEKYLWYGASKLLAVFDESENLLQRFEYADDHMPVAMTRQGSTYFLSYDPNGSLRLVTDASGSVVKRIDYDPFGYVLQDSAPAFAIPLGFGGGLYDADTGLVRIGRRDYDPDTGRWTFKHPDLFAGGDTDLYGYVQNDPVSFLDGNHKGASIWSGYGAAWAYGSAGTPSQYMLPNGNVASATMFGKGVSDLPAGRTCVGSSQGGLFAGVNEQNSRFMADDRPCRGIQWTSLSDYLFKGLFGGFYSGVGTPVDQILPNNTQNATQITVQPGESIQDAIDLALDGDEIVLADGVHTLPAGADYLDFAGKMITLRSANGPANCIIDLENTKSGFRFFQGEDEGTKVVGLTITNGAGESGGALMCDQASPTIESCIFINNQGVRGGAIYLAQSSANLINCTIVKNTATATGPAGGGIYVHNGSPRIINCTVADNTASSGQGGGLYSHSDDGSHDTEVISSIFWNNSDSSGADQIQYNADTTGNGQLFSDPPQVGHSDVQGGIGGIGNLDMDPRFADAASDNYHLQNNSPCIDAGGSQWAPDHDIDGDARPTGWYDMGSDETSVVSGTTTYIQQLIDEANDGDVVLVPPGTYGIGNRNLDFKGKAITLRAAPGAGGVVIDVGGLGRGVVFTSGEGPDSVLDGFTIKNGRADVGGGIYIDGASPTLVNCTIVKNTATATGAAGGGIYVRNGAPRIINCTVADNLAPNGYGGGLYSHADDSVHGTLVTGSIFWNNTSGSGSGQIAYNSGTDYNGTPENSTAPEVRHSNLQGGMAGAGIIDADPRFVNAATDDYHLQSDSPCIDAGSSQGAPDHDMDGDARPTGWYDMGSDETDVITGTTFIQQLIDDAVEGEVVLVPPGIYNVGNRNLDFKGKAITLRSAAGAGGVVIDVGGLGRGVVFISGEGPDSVLDGFTIKNGSADVGGGVYIDGASPTLVNCTIVKNTATAAGAAGGGIYVRNGAPRIMNCTVADNAAPNGSAGGIYSFADNAQHGMVVNSSIAWNNSSALPSGQIDYNQLAIGSDQYISDPPEVTYSDVQGGLAESGNIAADPHFVDAGADDYHLRTDSPCIDVGNMSAAAGRDLDGDARPQRWFEMGSDELSGVLPDYWQQQYFGTTGVDPAADSDNDGLTHLQEYLIFCADPTNPDSDNDGLTDGEEYNAGTSLCTSDMDGDGMSDEWEIAYGLNPMTNDAGGDPDGDGLTNAIEFAWQCLSPLNPDTDGDTLGDGQEDVNANGVRDGGETDPCTSDTDGDGMPDDWELANALDPNVPDADGDPDGDGLTNAVEYQWGCLSPQNRDTDGDGIADGAEDSNHNGMLDAGETDPCNGDTDGDGTGDGCQAGIDPYPPEISLRGAASVSICQNDTYTDPGATAVDNCDGDLTGSIVTDNPVDTSQPGVYVVTYTVSDGQGNAAVPATRTVVVLGPDDTMQIDTTYEYDEIGRLRRITKQAQ